MIPEKELEELRLLRRKLPFADPPAQVPAGTLWLVPKLMDPEAPTMAELAKAQMIGTAWESWPFTDA